MSAALPTSLDPLVTTHLASAAYRIEGDLAAWAWTMLEQEAMARAVVALDRERQQWRRERHEVARFVAARNEAMQRPWTRF